MKIYLYSIWQTEFQHNFQLNLCSAYKAPHTKHITSFILITTPSGKYHCHPHFTEKEKQRHKETERLGQGHSISRAARTWHKLTFLPVLL